MLRQVAPKNLDVDVPRQRPGGQRTLLDCWRYVAELYELMISGEATVRVFVESVSDRFELLQAQWFQFSRHLEAVASVCVESVLDHFECPAAQSFFVLYRLFFSHAISLPPGDRHCVRNVSKTYVLGPKGVLVERKTGSPS
jgi:hypothetical protein